MDILSLWDPSPYCIDAGVPAGAPYDVLACLHEVLDGYPTCQECACPVICHYLDWMEICHVCAIN